eukprot:3914166-Prymnesium_polylepis.2
MHCVSRGVCARGAAGIHHPCATAPRRVSILPHSWSPFALCTARPCRSATGCPPMGRAVRRHRS